MTVRYRHYKGGIYELVCEAQLESDPSTTLVIYKSADGKTWARLRQIFFEKIEYKGQLISRFERIAS